MLLDDRGWPAQTRLRDGALDSGPGERRLDPRQLGRGDATDVSYNPLGPLPAPDWAALEAWLMSRFGAGSLAASETAAPELMMLGLRDEAEAAVRALAGQDPWATARAMRAAATAGLPDLAATYAVQLRQRAGVSSVEAPKELARLAYPLSYVVSLDGAAAENGVDPLFLAALVRTESFWDASAGSPAGALGLTQVIPVTGEAIAASLGYPAFAAEDLFRPSVSLAFGANYIGGQVRRFGNPYYALELATSSDPGDTLPESLAGALRARLATLSPTARAVALTAAALGRFDERLHSTVHRRGLDELRATSVVVIREGVPTFAHPLLASTLLAMHTNVERRAVHASLARALTQGSEVVGEALFLDTMYVGNLKGVGKVWQYTGVDGACSFGFARVRAGKKNAAAITAPASTARTRNTLRKPPSVRCSTAISGTATEATPSDTT